jgi:epoxyqueuosine reductase QueG
MNVWSFVWMNKTTEQLVEQIRAIAEDEGVPVLGFGSASAMANELPGHRPEDLLPGAQSLICFGIPVPREVYHMPAYGLETVWRTQNLLYRRLDTLSARFAALLAQNGAGAVPTYGCMPLGMNERGVVVGYLNQLRMAEVTGIGVIGKNGLLLHSRYGSRLMLGGVLTTAVLPEAHYPDVDEPGCPPDCRICAEACPVGAIMPDKRQVKIMRCLGYTARTPAMSKLKFLLLRAFSSRVAARYMSLTAFDEHTFHRCSRCVALCPYGGEK